MTFNYHQKGVSCMKELSNKVAKAPRSKIRELMDLAAGKKDIISLGIGQPDFLTPAPAIEGNITKVKLCLNCSSVISST